MSNTIQKLSKHSYSFVLFRILLASIIGIISAKHTIVLRPAYGISIARVAGLQAEASARTHTFTIEIPDIDEQVMLPKGPCEVRPIKNWNTVSSL